jgi:hypothetical protein
VGNSTSLSLLKNPRISCRLDRNFIISRIGARQWRQLTILFSNIFPWANENNQKSLVPCISETLSIVLIYTATSEKRSQSRPDLTLPMATSHGPPLFPQPPTSAPAAIPAPSVASSYVPLKSPAQGSGRPSQGGWVLKK